MTPITVIILAKNEEAFIARAITSVPWADEVIVIDSGSTDQTKEIASSLGASVYEQPWLGWPGQRSKGVSLAKNDWVFFLESDEIVSHMLSNSITSVLQGHMNERDGYSVDRRGDFMGILLPNEARRSKPLVRIFNRLHSAYDQDMLVHEEVRFPGNLVCLEGVLLHWRGFTMDQLILVFNRYASIEAQALNKRHKRATVLSIFFGPILRFLWSYIFKGGWRLGTRGLIHSMLKASSDYMRYAKLWELQNVTPTIHPPPNVYVLPDGPKNSSIATPLNKKSSCP